MLRRMVALTLLSAVWVVLAGCEPQDTGAPFEPRVGEAERDRIEDERQPQAVPGDPARPGDPAQPAPGEPLPGQQPAPPPGQAAPGAQDQDPARTDDRFPEDPERQNEPDQLRN